MTSSRDVASSWTGDDRVAVIIVNYRTPQLTVACVDSVRRSGAIRPRIIVVDNASGDDSVDHLRSAFGDLPDVTFIARSVNDGYTGGNNAGVAIATQMGARYAFILNSDTIVGANCIRLLVDEAERDAAIALVTPRIFFGDPPERLWFGGARFSLWHGRAVHVGWTKAAARGWTEPRDLPFASGCALLVKLAAVKSLGRDLFDASLFAYAEDLDLSLRVRAAGYRIRYVPDARVDHFEGSSHRQPGGQSLRFYLATRNLLRVDARYARWYHWITLAPLLAVDVIGRFCLVAIRRRDRYMFAAVVRGAWHAIRGRQPGAATDRNTRS